MKEFKFNIEGKSYTVSVNESAENVAEVVVNGKTFNVGIEKKEAKKTVVKKVVAPKATTNSAPSAAPVQKSSGGSNSVKSPLPGSVVKVLVSAGQAVKRGDTIVTIESMKMENSVMANRDGSIIAVHVQPGQSVLQGDALFDLE